MSERERFMKRVQVGGPSACWEWTGCRMRGGKWHGAWRNGAGRTETTHRAAWRFEHGEIPAGVCVLHRCDNPACCNPDHLFLGTQSDNSLDMWAKGRARPRSLRGEEHGRAKITAEDVHTIRASGDPGVALAHRFGITRATVCAIRKRRIWKHVA